jgi:hypothetical protein
LVRFALGVTTNVGEALAALASPDPVLGDNGERVGRSVLETRHGAPRGFGHTPFSSRA